MKAEQAAAEPAPEEKKEEVLLWIVLRSPAKRIANYHQKCREWKPRSNAPLKFAKSGVKAWVSKVSGTHVAARSSRVLFLQAADNISSTA